MRVPAWLLLLLFFGPLQLACASWWVDPSPCEAVSEDGRHYLQLSPSEDEHGVGRFVLMRRASGSPLKPHSTGSPLYSAVEPPVYDWSHAEGRLMWIKSRLVPDEGDRVLAKGRCWLPRKVACLDGGVGFVSLGRYGGTSGNWPMLARYDGDGREVWSKRLGDVFTESQLATFAETSNGYEWCYSAWVTGKHVILIYVGKYGRPLLLRVHVDTGDSSEGAPEDLLSRIAPHSSLPEETEGAAFAALFHRCPQARVAARRSWETEVSEPTRSRLALLLAACGDPEAQAYLRGMLERAPLPDAEQNAVSDADYSAFQYVVPNLHHAFGEDAVELLLRTSNTIYWREAFVGLGRMRQTGMRAVVKEAAARPATGDAPLYAMRSYLYFPYQEQPLAEDLSAVLPSLEARERALAAWWLGCLDKGGDMLPALKTAAEDSSSAVRAAAIAAIVRVNPAEARHFPRALVDGCESEEYEEVVRPALEKIGAALEAEGESGVLLLLLYWRFELLAGLLGVAVWYGLAARYWAGPGLRGLQLAGVSALACLPPVLASVWTVCYACEQPWVGGFLPRRPEFSFLPVPALTVLSLSVLWLLLALAVCARKPAKTSGASESPRAGATA